jgi:hypothetical protein
VKQGRLQALAGELAEGVVGGEGELGGEDEGGDGGEGAQAGGARAGAQQQQAGERGEAEDPTKNGEEGGGGECGRGVHELLRCGRELEALDRLA